MKTTKKNIDLIIDTLIICVDTREKIPNHITECFDKYGVNWRREKLESGDYSCVVPPNEELGFLGIDFRNICCIERKMSCDEIIRNLTKYKNRFYYEFERTEAYIPILIEDKFKNACEGNYISKVTPKQFLGALFTFCERNNTYFYFIENKEYSALWIYNIFKYKLKEFIKGGGNHV